MSDSSATGRPTFKDVIHEDAIKIGSATKRLSLGVLTDFEEFAVYDGRIKPWLVYELYGLTEEEIKVVEGEK